MEKRSGFAMAVVLAFSSSASFADCAGDAEGSSCPESADAPQAQTSASVESEKTEGYTWEELVEAIPQLKEFELEHRRSKKKGTSKDEGTYMVCQKVKAPDSRIKRRTCMPLTEYLAYVTRERTAAEQARLEFLSRRSVDPVSTIIRRYN